MVVSAQPHDQATTCHMMHVYLYLLFELQLVFKLNYMFGAETQQYIRISC